MEYYQHVQPQLKLCFNHRASDQFMAAVIKEVLHE
jgi:hypothetical protein